MTIGNVNSKDSVQRSIDTFKISISNYNTLLGEINIVIGYLSNARTNILDANKSLDKYYKIDNRIADNGKLVKVANDSASTIDYLTKTVIPEINREIARFNSNIATLSKSL